VDNLQNIVNAIKPIYPENATIKAERPDRIVIFWPLNNDPNRPAKISRAIRVILSYEFTHPYKASSQDRKIRTLAKIVEKAKQHFKSFNPDHSSPANIEVPTEEIIIGAEYL
jgi:hypothetical protein